MTDHPVVAKRKPYFGVTSVNYDFTELMRRAELPS